MTNTVKIIRKIVKKPYKILKIGGYKLGGIRGSLRRVDIYR